MKQKLIATTASGGILLSAVPATSDSRAAFDSPGFGFGFKPPGIRLKQVRDYIFGIMLSLGAQSHFMAQIPGTLDNTFGTGGVKLSNIHSFVSDDLGRGLVIQPDGKIVVAGISDDGTNYHFAVTRYNTNGTLDNTFSSDGKVFTALTSGMDLASAVALQSDGKIVVCGTSASNFTLIRYNSNGTVDNTFGTSGMVFTPVSSGSEGANTLLVQPDGKILVGGFARFSGNDDIAIVRYNADGSLDNGFATGGVLTSSLGSGNEAIWSLSLQPDGKILAAGYKHNGTILEFAITRLNSNGTFDSGFGTGGFATSAPTGSANIATCVALQPDGKIILGGRSFGASNFDFSLSRFDSAGSLDATFGSAGKQVTSVGGQDYGTSVVLQQNGKIILAGYSNIGGNTDFVIIRYNNSGLPDNSFGTGGIVTNGIGVAIDEIRGAALQSDGKLVVAGSANDGVNANDFAVARYNFECLPAVPAPASIVGSTITCKGLRTYSTAAISGATSYTWSLPNGWTGSSVTNSISVNAVSSGTIRVAAMNFCGTSATASLAVKVTTCTSITDEHEFQRSVIFPNPTTGRFTLDTQSENPFSYRLLNLQGVTVGSGDFVGKTVLDLTGFPAGTYIINLFGVETTTSRLIILTD